MNDPIGEKPFDLAMAQRIFQSQIPHCRELAMRIVSMDGGLAIVGLPYDPRLVGNPETGVLHGGAVTTLIDSVCGLAVFMAHGPGAQIATLDLRIDYLRHATPGMELLASAECYKIARTITFVRGRAYHADAPDDWVASCVAAFLADNGGATEDKNP
jgi:uncharacterized protein (TIGR00369 family)